jgi:hypothetical protein
MIGSLITSQTRVKLLKKFFLNSNIKAHLRGLESEFGESTNAIRVELNRLEGAGLLVSVRAGNKKLFQANLNHPLFHDIHNIILKDAGIDRVIDKVVHRLGNLSAVYLTGELAKGMDSPVIEILLIGRDLDKEYLERKARQAEEIVGRKVVYSVMDPEEAENIFKSAVTANILLLWNDGNEKEC